MEEQNRKIKKNNIKLIYIVGNGHSGSTLLSFILSADKKVFNVSELKFYNENRLNDINNENVEYMKNACSCGSSGLECPFWSKIDKDFKGKDLDIFHYKKFVRLFYFFLVLVPFYRFKKTIKNSDEKVVIKKIMEEANKSNDYEFILDASKSLDRLIYLNKHKDFNIRIVFINRNIAGCVNSFNKVYKKGFFRWIFYCKLNNFLIKNYLRKIDNKVCTVNYDDLCKDTEKTINKINKEMEIKVPSNFLENIRKIKFHVRAGNPMKNKIKKIKALKYDEDWKNRMNYFQKFVLKLFSEK